jgi:hypothetical protein
MPNGANLLSLKPWVSGINILKPADGEGKHRLVLSSKTSLQNLFS